jgi:hypothetical protein
VVRLHSLLLFSATQPGRADQAESHHHAETAEKLGKSRLLVRTATGHRRSEVMRGKFANSRRKFPSSHTIMGGSLAENVAAPRFRTLLLGIFARLDVCLAMAGVYGVMAYVVGQRTSRVVAGPDRSARTKPGKSSKSSKRKLQKSSKRELQKGTEPD